MNHDARITELLDLQFRYHHEIGNVLAKNCSIGEVSALLCLLRSESVLSSGELSRMLSLTSGRTANLLKALEKKRYILRSMDPEDRRRVLVTLTHEGRSFITKHYDTLLTTSGRCFDRLGSEDAQTLTRLMEQLLSSACGKDSRYDS